MYDPETFAARVEPLRAATADLVRSSRAMRERQGFLPAGDSEAMAERDQEDEWAGEWGTTVVLNAQLWGGMLLVVGEDHIGSLCRLLAHTEATAYSPQVLARAALEASGRARWMLEPGIGVKQRVARWQTERLYNAYEMQSLAGEDERYAEIRRSILDEARRRNLETISGKRYRHTHLEDLRPTTTKVISSLVGDADAKLGLGRVAVSYYSGVAHGTLSAITQSIEIVPDSGSDVSPSLGIVRMSAVDTNSLLAVVTLGFGTAVEVLRTLYGWTDEEWQRSWANSIELVRREVEIQTG